MGSTAGDNELAGYRLVRKLGSGSRADVYLGAGTTGTTAIKAFTPAATEESIWAELDALGRIEHPHFVRLLDVASAADDVPILILERVHRGSVAGLLRDRDSLEKGEVVTLLAPLAGALPGLHSLGVAHGRIGAGSVHIGGAGQPVLLGFGHCELFERDASIAAIDAEPAAARDRDALAALAISLLSRVRDAATDRRVVELVEWIDAAPREFEFTERLEARLFDFADAVPLDVPAAPAPLVPSVPARIVPARSLPVRSVPVGVATTDRVSSLPPIAPAAQPSAPSAQGALGRLDSLLRDNPMDAAKARVGEFVRGVRRPFWVAAGAVVVAIVLAATLLPQNPSASRAIASATPNAAESATAPTPTSLPDDPVKALPHLLYDRLRCIRDLSVLCLDTVDEQSSSAYTADAALIERVQAGSEIPKSETITATAPVLTEQLGDAALVALGGQDQESQGKPASILMFRSEAGWRIRGYLSGIQSTGSPSSSG